MKRLKPNISKIIFLFKLININYLNSMIPEEKDFDNKSCSSYISADTIEILLSIEINKDKIFKHILVKKKLPQKKLQEPTKKKVHLDSKYEKSNRLPILPMTVENFLLAANLKIFYIAKHSVAKHLNTLPREHGEYGVFLKDAAVTIPPGINTYKRRLDNVSSFVLKKYMLIKELEISHFKNSDNLADIEIRGKEIPEYLDPFINKKVFINSSTIKDSNILSNVFSIFPNIKTTIVNIKCVMPENWYMDMSIFKDTYNLRNIMIKQGTPKEVINSENILNNSLLGLQIINMKIPKEYLQILLNAFSAIKNLWLIHIPHQTDMNISLKHLTKIQKLFLKRTCITNLDLKDFPELSWLDLSRNNLKEVNIKANSLLVYLNLNCNKISSLDLTQNIKIKQIFLENNKIVSLNDISININSTITFLQCSYNHIMQGEFININSVMRCKTIIGLNVSYNYLLTILDLSHMEKLEELHAESTNLHKIKINHLHHLKILNLSKNKLRFLSIPKNSTNLTRIELNNNNLTSRIFLDVSSAVNLKQIYLCNNKDIQVEAEIIHIIGKMNLSKIRLDGLKFSIGKNKHMFECDSKQISKFLSPSLIDERRRSIFCCTIYNV
jgi:hypothetical protein